MNDLAILRALIRPEALAAISTQKGTKNTVTLAGRNNCEYELSVTGAPRETIAVNADRFPSPEPIFQNSRHECRRADYVIFANDGNRCWIIYIEMKLDKDRKKKIEQQLGGARCLVSYCQAIVQEFWGERDFLRDCAERFVSVGSIGINKRPTRERPSSVHDSPKNMLKITAPRGILQFNKLL
jgi:hypothetical protein